MKAAILPVALSLAVFSCNKRTVTPESMPAEGQPDRQIVTPTPNTDTGQGSGTRSDYEPSTGPGGRQESQN